jgi:hypothetical protein
MTPSEAASRIPITLAGLRALLTREPDLVPDPTDLQPADLYVIRRAVQAVQAEA